MAERIGTRRPVGRSGAQRLERFPLALKPLQFPAVAISGPLGDFHPARNRLLGETIVRIGISLGGLILLLLILWLLFG